MRSLGKPSRTSWSRRDPHVETWWYKLPSPIAMIQHGDSIDLGPFGICGFSNQCGTLPIVMRPPKGTRLRQGPIAVGWCKDEVLKYAGTPRSVSRFPDYEVWLLNTSSGEPPFVFFGKGDEQVSSVQHFHSHPA